jgi:hypothetical protein
MLYTTYKYSSMHIFILLTYLYMTPHVQSSRKLQVESNVHRA